MKVCICGSRNFLDYSRLRTALLSFMDKFNCRDSMEIVSGCARGADSLGECFAREFGLKVFQFPAKWDIFGNTAGFVRNKEMAEFSDVVIAFWDGQSSGTKGMIEHCKEIGKQVYVVRTDI